MRQLAGLRELPKFYIVLILGEMHRQLLRVGADMAAAGTIAAANDVFFLDFDEIRVGLRGADLHGIVAARRRLYDTELRRRRIPRLLLSDGTDVEAALMANSPASGALTGTPASDSDFSSDAMPSGAASSVTAVMSSAPRSSRKRMASIIEPPVASIGSRT